MRKAAEEIITDAAKSNNGVISNLAMDLLNRPPKL
jgi:hypothetical protein